METGLLEDKKICVALSLRDCHRRGLYSYGVMTYAMDDAARQPCVLGVERWVFAWNSVSGISACIKRSMRKRF